MNRVFVLFFLMMALGGLGLASCGDGYGSGDHVGTPCARNNDCPGMRCLTGSRYPGGTCTYSCDSDADCPSYAACIDRDGGVCLPLCHSHRDCRIGYNCDDQRNRGRSGRSYVCIND